MKIPADRIVGVLLAAGIGRRFDPSGQQLKLLAPVSRGAWAGQPLAIAALRNLRAAMADVVVVLRPARDEQQRQLHSLLAAEGARLVICPQAEAGMGASLAAGVAASSDAAGWLILLADMPAVLPSTIAAVRDALLRGHDTAAACFRGQRGHPVGFSRGCRDALLNLTGDAGARSVLSEHPPLLVDVDDPGCLLDIDTHADGASPRDTCSPPCSDGRPLVP
jgi:molybdenum cofactor cytidylyltransferase